MSHVDRTYAEDMFLKKWEMPFRLVLAFLGTVILLVGLSCI
jgi:hypothetical protein